MKIIELSVMSIRFWLRMRYPFPFLKKRISNVSVLNTWLSRKISLCSYPKPTFSKTSTPHSVFMNLRVFNDIEV